MLLKFVAQYRAITDAYIGTRTDWVKVYNELSKLADDMNKAAASRFYPRKRELKHLWYLQYKEIREEMDRIVNWMK